MKDLIREATYFNNDLSRYQDVLPSVLIRKWNKLFNKIIDSASIESRNVSSNKDKEEDYPCCCWKKEYSSNSRCSKCNGIKMY